MHKLGDTKSETNDSYIDAYFFCFAYLEQTEMQSGFLADKLIKGYQDVFKDWDFVQICYTWK